MDTADQLAASFCDDGAAPDPNLMGKALARIYEWDSRIIEAAAAAMTDANFHTLAKPLYAYLESIGVDAA